MGDALKRRKFAVSVAALALGLTLAGCNGSGDPEPTDTATSANGSASPTESAPNGVEPTAASPDPSASGDWWPEQPETMATGQEFPDDYEPATLEHPARNVPKPVMPDEAKQETEAGAQAFLDYRTDAFWYAFQTGDTSLVREVTAESCEQCLKQFESIDNVYSESGWMAGGYERSEILPGSFFAGSNGIYTLPVDAISSGVKMVEDSQLTLQQHPFETDEGFNVNIDFRDGLWTYVTGSPRNSQDIF